MKVKYFCFWLIVLSVTFSSEAMVFEQPAARVARLAISTNSLRRCFTQSTESIRGFSEEAFSPYRKVHAHFPSNNPIFPILSTINYQRDQTGKYFNWRLLTAGIGIASVLFGEEVHAEGSVSLKTPKRDLTDEELGLCLLEGRKKIDEGYKLLKSINKRNAVFIIGNTGDGKTVLSLYLAGHKPVFERTDTKNKKVDFPQAPCLVGHDPNGSCTLYPELRLIEDIALWDCPGFRDTRGENYHLAANVFLDYLTRSGEGASFVIVVDDSSLEVGKGNFFRKVLKDISNLLTNSKGELFDPRSPQGTLLDSLVWVITKSPEGRKLEHLKIIITKKDSWFESKVGEIVAKLASTSAKFIGNESTKADKEITARDERTIKEKALVSSCLNNLEQLNFENQNREKILSCIRKAKVVFDVQSTFVDEKQRKDLVAFSEKVFTRAIELEQENEKARREKDELDNNLQVKRQLQTLDLAGFLRVVSTEIENIKTKKEENRRKFLGDTRYLDELLQRDEEEVLVWEFPPKFERRTRTLPGMLNPFRSTHPFNHEDAEKPFTKVVVEKDIYTTQEFCLGENGSIPVPFPPAISGYFCKGEAPRHSSTYILEKPSNKFTAVYVGSRGRECRVEVNLYGKRSKLASNNTVKMLLKRDLQETASTLEKLEKDLNFFEYLRNETNDKGIDAGKKLLKQRQTDLSTEQRLIDLTVEAEKIKQEFERQRDIGYSLLAMGPKFLDTNLLAVEFKRKCKKEEEGV